MRTLSRTSAFATSINTLGWLEAIFTATYRGVLIRLRRRAVNSGKTPIGRRGNTLTGIQKVLRRTADLAHQTQFPAAGRTVSGSSRKESNSPRGPLQAELRMHAEYPMGDKLTLLFLNATPADANGKSTGSCILSLTGFR